MTLYLPEHPVYRGLSDGFLQALEALADDEVRGRWWRDVLAHPDLVLAVRRNSLNVYFRGGSLFLVRFIDGQVETQTHVKYLMRTKQPRLYTRLSEGVFDIDPAAMVWKAYEGKKTLAELMATAAMFAGPEKTGLHSLILASPNVVDVEVSLQGSGMDQEPEEEESIATAMVEAESNAVAADIAALLSHNPTKVRKKPPPQDRLDVATLEDRGQPDEAWLVFHEAKHYGNKELRSEGKRPPVANQLDRYIGTISEHHGMILAGYPRLCRDLVRLDAMRRKVREAEGMPTSAMRALDPIVAEVAEGNRQLCVEPRPRLVVFGFDKDQRDGAWQGHDTKLKGLGWPAYALGDPTGKTSAAFRYRPGLKPSIQPSVVVYFRTRPYEPEASEQALAEQRAAVAEWQSANPDATILVEHCEVERDVPANERPALAAAVAAAKAAGAKVLFASTDAIGSGEPFDYRIASVPTIELQSSKPPAETILLPMDAPSTLALLFRRFGAMTMSVYLCNAGSDALEDVAVSSQGVTANGPDGTFATSVPTWTFVTIPPGTGRRIGSYNVMTDGEFITSYSITGTMRDGVPLRASSHIDKGGPKTKWQPMTIKAPG